MKEIEKTLATMKARAKETAIIVLLHSTTSLIVSVPKTLGIDTIDPLWFFLVLRFGIMIFASICLYGFLRSVYLNQSNKRTIGGLMKIGKSFFWRIFTFWLLMSMVVIPLAWIVSFVVKGPALYRMQFWVFSVILIKPMILIPAIIITLDCTLATSFGLLKRYKLFEAKELIFMYLLMLAVSSLWIFSTSIPASLQSMKPVFGVFLTIIKSFIYVAIFITAIRFVENQVQH